MNKIIRQLRRRGVIARGARLINVDSSVVIGEGVVIEDNVTILGKSYIESGAYIGSGSYLYNAHIGKGTRVLNSQIEDAYIGHNGTIGPYAHVHKVSQVGDNIRIGNFVEVKNSNIGDGTKVAHLAYVGDADIGAGCNIGCGAVFVNYDGITKHRSTIGDGVFVGSNVNVIAPICIADGAYIAAGSTVTIDLAPNDLCIARAYEVVKPNRSKYKTSKRTK